MLSVSVTPRAHKKCNYMVTNNTKTITKRFRLRVNKLRFKGQIIIISPCRQMVNVCAVLDIVSIFELLFLTNFTIFFLICCLCSSIYAKTNSYNVYAHNIVILYYGYAIWPYLMFTLTIKVLKPAIKLKCHENLRKLS